MGGWMGGQVDAWMDGWVDGLVDDGWVVISLLEGLLGTWANLFFIPDVTFKSVDADTFLWLKLFPGLLRLGQVDLQHISQSVANQFFWIITSFLMKYVSGA